MCSGAWLSASFFLCAAAAGAVAGLANSGLLHKAAVATTCAGMKVADAVTAETQAVVDDANDVAAEARRQAKIDAAVADRLSCLLYTSPSPRD